MKKLSLLLMTIFTTSALANSDDYQGESFWLNGAIGQAQFSDNTSLINKGLSLKLNLGYDFTEHFAVYGGIGSFQNLTNKNINYLETGIKGILPLNSDWSAYGTLAATSVFSSDISGKLQPKIGVGVSYQITPKFSTQISYNYFKNIGFDENFNKDVGQITWGLTYYFNRKNVASRAIQQIKIHE